MADGSMLNLTAGFGDSLNAFDVTLAVMASGIRHIVTDGMQAKSGCLSAAAKRVAAGAVSTVSGAGRRPEAA